MNSQNKPYKPLEQNRSSGSKSWSGKNDNWIFFTAVFVSALFWMLIKLSDPYTVPYSLKVSYTNVPNEKRLTFISDSFVSVNVTARGFEILELNLSEDMDILDINLENFSLMKKDGQEYFVYTDELNKRLADVIGIQENNVHFSKNTLSFRMADLQEKKLPVTNIVQFEFSEQFDLYEKPIFTPETVTVFGPAEILDTLQQVYTQNMEILEVNSNQDIRVKLHNPLPDILKFEPEEVSIKIRVEKFTTSSIEVPIDLPGLKQSIKLFPKTVKIHFKVAQKDYNNIRPSQFEVIPDIKNIDIRKAVRLQLRLAKKPGFIRNTTLDPTDVEFLIIK